MNDSGYAGLSSQIADRNINLTLTDLRQSTWNSWPQNKPKQQRDLTLKNVILTECNRSSYGELRRVVALALRQNDKEPRPTTSEFIICDPFRQIYDEKNVHKLVNDAYVILLDEGQKTLPLIYKHGYTTVPHTRSVTNQEGKFHGTEEHNPAGLALAELVDNALSATAHLTAEERTIEIIFCDGDSPSIHVLDNGCGMDALQSSLKYKAPKEDRQTAQGQKQATIECNKDEIHPIYVNSNISKFGAGLKQAAFFLGTELRIMTKRENINEVYEVHYDSEIMEEKEKLEHEDPWKVYQSNRVAGDLSLNTNDLPPHLITLLEGQEKAKKSFTHISILHVRRDRKNLDTVLGFLKRHHPLEGTNIEKQLKHVYFYYLLGRGGIIPNSEIDSTVNLNVTRMNSAGEPITRTKLVDAGGEYLDLESKLHLSSTSDPYLFTIEVSDTSAKSKEKPFKVGGIIRYHPFKYDRETHPLGGTTHRKIIESGDSPPSGSNTPRSDGEDSSSMFERSAEFFQIWWNGRLIPHTRLESFYWCSPNSKMKANDKLYKSYGRISGSLFFDSHVSGVTDNKLCMTTTANILQMFKEKTIGSKVSHFQRITVNSDGSLKVQRMKAGKPKSDFEDWLKRSQKYDKEVIYLAPMQCPSSEEYLKIKYNSKNHYYYRNARWEIERKVGDIVRITGQFNLLGKITGFLVDSENFQNKDSSEPDKMLAAPLSYFEMQLQPVHVYGNGRIIIKEMRLVDKTVGPKEGQRLVREQLNELKALKITEEWLGTGTALESGDSISIESVLIGKLKLDIINSNGNSIYGCLPSSKKAIQMVARIYKIHDDDNSYELYYTSAVCKYLQGGFYFEKINLKHIEDIQSSGNYVVKFHSFVEPEDDQNTTAFGVNGNRQSTSSTYIRSRRSNSSCVNGPSTSSEASATAQLTIEDTILPHAIEWAQEVDKLGRKILSDNGENQIRLPFHEIFFTLNPGSPQSVEIEEFGEADIPIRIGKPFKIVLSFKDAKGSPTTSNLEKTIEQRPVISIYKNKRNRDNIELTFEYKRSKFTSDGKLIIEDVISSGSLRDRETKECQVEISISNESHKKQMKSRIGTVFHVGIPHKLEVSPKPIIIENGTMPSIACRVLDICGNMIPFLDNRKPISLACEIGRIDKNGRYKFRLLDPQLLATDDVDKPQLLDERLEYEELKSGTLDQIEVKCQLRCDAFPNITSAEFPITIIPSTRPEKLRLYLKKAEGMEEIQNETELVGTLGTKLKIFFKLFDGRGNEVDFNPEAHRLEVNKEKVTKMEFIFDIPLKSERKTIQSKVKIMGFRDQSLKHAFQLVSYPLEAQGIKVFFCVSEQPVEGILVPIDGFLPDILVQLVDRYDNLITAINEDELGPNVEVMMGDGTNLYDYKCVRDTENLTGRLGSFLIKGEGDAFRGSALGLGAATLTVQYERFHDNLHLTVIPGVPCDLQFDINGEQKNNHSICVFPNQTKIRVRAQLVDKFKNPSPPQSTSKNERIKIGFSVQKKDAQGKFVEQPGSVKLVTLVKTGVADFGTMTIEVDPNSIISTLSQSSFECKAKHGVTEKCFGNIIKMIAQTTLLGKPIFATCHFHLLCRPDTAFKIVPSWIDNEYQGRGFCYEAGSTFKTLTVTVKAEDGSDFKAAKATALNLDLRSEQNYLADPITVTAKSVSEGVYIFGKVPSQAGVYAVDISYIDETKNLRITHRMDEKLQILPAAVKFFEPEQPVPQNIIVSNGEERSNRVIIKGMTLVLKDAYGNMCSSAEGMLEITATDIVLELHQTVLKEYNIRNGKVEIPELVLSHGITLQNKTEYGIIFNALLKEKSFLYSLKFTFIDNVQQQLEIRQLNEENEGLTIQIKNTETFIAKTNSKKLNLERDYESSLRVEEETRGRLLRDFNIPINTLNGLKSIEDVGEFERILLTKESHQMQERSRCGASSNIPPGPVSDEQEEVLGRIGHLVQIKPEAGTNSSELQRAISWYIQGHLLVYVVKKERKAHELRTQFPSEQFMILEILRSAGDNRANQNQGPPPGPGSPVYVKDLLWITHSEGGGDVQKVLNTILGNTILVNTLQDATAYVREFNRRNTYKCPNILTRDGHKLTGLGIIGGASNSAPQNLKYRLGLAPSTDLLNIQTQLRMLPQLNKVVEDRIVKERGLQEFKDKTDGEVMKRKDELEQWKGRTAEIKKTLNGLKEVCARMSTRLRTATPTSGIGEGSPSKRPRRH